MDRSHIDQRVVSRDLFEISASVYERLFDFLLSAHASPALIRDADCVYGSLSR